METLSMFAMPLALFAIGSVTAWFFPKTVFVVSVLLALLVQSIANDSGPDALGFVFIIGMLWALAYGALMAAFTHHVALRQAKKAATPK